MSTYKVAAKDHAFYVMPFDVETYVRKGYDLYKEIRTPIDDVDMELNYIQNEMTSEFSRYWVEKDGVSLLIQPFRIKDFYDRGYSIFTKSLKKIEDPYAEIDKINSSDAILPLE